MSLLFEDSNCNTVHWEEIPITVCWEIDKAKFVCSDSQKLPVIGDKILISVACEHAYINSTIKLAVKELNEIGYPEKEIHRFDITINAPKPSSLTLKKEWKNKTLVLACENPEYTGYDSPIRVGTEVLKGVALCYTDWSKVTFDDFAFNEDAKKRRADEYIKIRMETKGGRNGILLENLPKRIQKLIASNDVVKNGIKALVEDKRKFLITLLNTPLFTNAGNDLTPLYYRIYGEYIPAIKIVVSTNTEREPDLKKINLTSQKDYTKTIDISKGKLFPRQKLTKNHEFVQSGLWEYLYSATIYEAEDYNENKEKYIRLSLAMDEIINSVGAHEETHAFQNGVTELMCYAVELESIKGYKNRNHD